MSPWGRNILSVLSESLVPPEDLISDCLGINKCQGHLIRSQWARIINYPITNHLHTKNCGGISHNNPKPTRTPNISSTMLLDSHNTGPFPLEIKAGIIPKHLFAMAKCSVVSLEHGGPIERQ